MLWLPIFLYFFLFSCIFFLFFSFPFLSFFFLFQVFVCVYNFIHCIFLCLDIMAFSSQPGFDITPFIPRRTSSTAHFIPQLIESLNPPIIRTSNDRRDPVPIQVTSDADMFCRLWIKYFNNPIMIKRAILQKLNILADYPYFEFTHENGPYSGK